MGLDVAVKIIADKVIITLINDRVAEWCESVNVPKSARLDRIKDFLEVWVELKVPIVMRVAKVVHIFCEVAKEENVGFANFASDFDLS